MSDGWSEIRVKQLTDRVERLEFEMDIVSDHLAKVVDQSEIIISYLKSLRIKTEEIEQWQMRNGKRKDL